MFSDLELFPQASLDDAIKTLRFGGHTKHSAARQTVRAASAEGNVEATYELLLHRVQAFETLREEVSDELRELTASLAANATTPRESSLACYAGAIALFSDQGLVAEAETRALLQRAADDFPWFKITLAHFEEGVRCQQMLARLDASGHGEGGEELFHFTRHELARVDNSNPANPWHLRALRDPRYDGWLARQTVAPVLPDGSPGPWPFEAFNRFEGRGKCWSGCRPILEGLLLFDANHDRFKIDDAIVWMAKQGEVDAVRFLADAAYVCASGAQPRLVPKALALAAQCGHAAVVREILSWGVSRAAKTEAMVQCCRSEHAFSLEVFELLREAGVSEDVVVQGATLLHHASAGGNAAGIRVLLHLGADPTAKNRDKKTPLQIVWTATKDAALLLRGAMKGSLPRAITIGKARDHADRAGTLASVDALLKEEWRELPLSNALGDPSDPMGALANALVGMGADKPKIKRGKGKRGSLHLDETEVIGAGITVSEELVVDAHVLVLGNVEATSVVVTESGSLAVAGDLTAKSIWCDGYLQAGGAIETVAVVAFDGGYISTPRATAEFGVFYDAGLDAKKREGDIFDIGSAEDEAYRAAEARLDPSCLTSAPEIGVGRIDFRAITKTAAAGEPLTR